MIEINSKYEILYNDLINLGIGEFLVSREYKKMLLQLNYHGAWKAIKKEAENDRNFVSIGMDHDKYDAEFGLILVLNDFDQDPGSEKFVFNIILTFIASKKYKTNFNNLLESMQLLKFENQYQQEILAQVKLHESKYTEESTKNNSQSNVMSKLKKRIFIVHGHKEGELNILARMLEKQGLDPIILNEQPSEGMTIIEKFEANAKSDFAIILLTGDDKGNQKDNTSLNFRARQNVIFEMGYFFALLGRKNVVCLQEENIEVPSDLGGRMYIQLDKSKNWKLKLIKELQHAGFDVTADKL